MKAIMLGKTCRIVTTSVAERHLTVLWGEISRFLIHPTFSLLESDGGPLSMTHMRLVRSTEREVGNPYNYCVGMVYEDPEKMAGHHAEITLGIGDEASGLDDRCYEMFQGWAKSMLWIGNPNRCNNFFKKAVKAGDLLAS